MKSSEIVFFSIVSDKFKPLGELVINSFKYFHPDIKHHIFGQKDIDRLTDGVDWDYYPFAQELIKDYKLVVNLDSDSIVCDRLTEIIEGDFDVAAPVNNNFNNRFFISLCGIKDEYVNAGLVAAVPEFWQDWGKKCVKFKDNRYFVHGEQDILNLIFYFGDYKGKVLDGKASKLFYGTSSRDSWGAAHVVGDRIYIGSRQVKVLHMADIEDKIHFDYRNYFREDVISYLDKICTPKP